MDFEKLLEELKSELLQLFGDKWTELKEESVKDIDQFLKDSEVKLKRWTALLATGDIDLEDFEWLVKSQKDLMLLQGLQSAGVHKITLGRFKNKIIDTILNVVTAVLL